jgi:hypothetical protein
MRKLKKRQLNILKALREFGGLASTKMIAERTGLNTNGVSQSLGAIGRPYVCCVGGKGGSTMWRLLSDAF